VARRRKLFNAILHAVILEEPRQHPMDIALVNSNQTNKHFVSPNERRRITNPLGGPRGKFLRKRSLRVGFLSRRLRPIVRLPAAADVANYPAQLSYHPCFRVSANRDREKVERGRERAESTTARNSEMKRGYSLARKVVLVNNHGEIGQQIFHADCFPQTAPRALAFVGHSIIRRD